MDMQTTELLVEAVKAYPVLYAKAASGSSAEQKNAAWQEISSKLNQPVQKCKAKWRNLRDAYNKAIKWKQELESVGKLSNYHVYKHEALLSFIEESAKQEPAKRKGSTYKQSRKFKKSKTEFNEADYGIEAQEYSSAVEYLIEADRPDSIKDEEEEDGYHQKEENIEHEEEQIVEYSEDLPNKLQEPETEQQSFYAFESTTVNNDNVTSAQQEEIPYQETFANETPNLSAELDSWLLGVKDTIMSLPKLMRARAKKQINDLVSDYEIKYLESLGDS